MKNKTYEQKVENLKDYVIFTEEGSEMGLFFRNPFQKIHHDLFSETKYNPYSYSEKIKNPIRKMYEILIGNGHTVTNICNWLDDMDFAGVNIIVLCLPIYFSRNYKVLEAVCQNPELNIQTIKSYGYESEFEYCSGSCEIERTKISLKNGKSMKLKWKDSYHYTYTHVIRDMFK